VYEVMLNKKLVLLDILFFPFNHHVCIFYTAGTPVFVPEAFLQGFQPRFRSIGRYSFLWQCASSETCLPYPWVRRNLHNRIDLLTHHSRVLCRRIQRLQTLRISSLHSSPMLRRFGAVPQKV